MAGQLIITVGLPASGKSTWAEDKRRLAPDVVRVVTMDDIRVAIGAQFEAGDEGVVQGIRDFAIRGYLEKGYTVISADTNLSPKTQRRLCTIAERAKVPATYEMFTHVDVFECMRRNDLRHLRGDDKVPNQAILKMHQQYLSKA